VTEPRAKNKKAALRARRRDERRHASSRSRPSGGTSAASDEAKGDHGRHHYRIRTHSQAICWEVKGQRCMFGVCRGPPWDLQGNFSCIGDRSRVPATSMEPGASKTALKPRCELGIFPSSAIGGGAGNWGHAGFGHTYGLASHNIRPLTLIPPSR
jgi:hypothetical protein